MTTVAIVGAGIGGVYLAAHLGMRGVKLHLIDLDDTRLADIRAHGGLDVEVDGKTTFSAIERISTNLADAEIGRAHV